MNDLDANAERYLELLRRCLTRYGLEDPLRYEPFRTHRSGLGRRLRLLVQAGLRRRGLAIVRPLEPVALGDREVGRDWPRTAETMVGLRRLENLQHCISDIIAEGVPGDLVETGAWRGGASIFMRAVLAAHEVSDRAVWVADSFEGLPKPNSTAYPADAGDEHWTYDWLSVTLDEVKENFSKYDLLDDQVRFLPGWFKDTLHAAPIDQIALLRLDGDMYESTIQALRALYARVSAGGFVIVDDYFAVEGCRRAVEDFRESHAISAPMVQIDWAAIYWRKPSV